MQTTIALMLICCCIAVGLGMDLFNPPKLSATMENLGVCPGLEKTVKGYLRNVQFKNAETAAIMSFDFVVKEDMPANALNVWTITKCRSREAPDTCVPFAPMRTSKLCSMMNSKDEMWVNLMKCYKPPLTCPMKKGVYQARNCSQNPNLFNIFPMSNSYWKFRMEMLHPRTKAVLMCIIIEGKVNSN